MIKSLKPLSWMGSIINDAMSAAGKDRNWFHMELDKLGVTIENVFMAQVDSYGDLTVDLYDDKITSSFSTSSSASFGHDQKCQADLELFAFETESDKAKGHV